MVRKTDNHLRWPESSTGLPVDVPAVPNLDHCDDQLPINDLVQDEIFSLAEAVLILPAEFLAAGAVAKF